MSWLNISTRPAIVRRAGKLACLLAISPNWRTNYASGISHRLNRIYYTRGVLGFFGRNRAGPWVLDRGRRCLCHYRVGPSLTYWLRSGAAVWHFSTNWRNSHAGKKLRHMPLVYAFLRFAKYRGGGSHWTLRVAGRPPPLLAALGQPGAHCGISAARHRLLLLGSKARERSLASGVEEPGIFPRFPWHF